jgi:UDP-2,4-diacetamido-2,4,6-trideoxy-beta-L-altropyranose hydrolase
MNVFFRVDSSIEIGSGHVMRCLTFADLLREKDFKISFICREQSGNLIDYIENKGFNVHRLKNGFNTEEIEYITDHSHWLTVNWETDVLDTIAILKNENNIDWLIIDHYAIEKKWENEIKPYVKNIMVIDDLADRLHDCKLLLDQNYFPDYENRYNGLVPRFCLKLLGPQYALLRSEFKNVPTDFKKRNGEIKHILIYFGGIDLTNETTKALEGIRLLKQTSITVDVVVGSTNPNKVQIKKHCSLMPNVNFYCQVSNMAELMIKADLAIGAGGITTWERCYLGLPSITIIIAKNQAKVLEALGDAGATWNLGFSHEVLSKDIAQKVSEALINPFLVRQMSEKSKLLIKGRGKLGNDLIMKLMLEEDNATN